MTEFELSDSSLNEECGIFALHKVEDASVLAYYGLHSLQHRGQEACGIATSDGSKILTRKAKGLVTDVCLKRKIRNYVALEKEDTAGFDIYIQEKSVLNNQHKKAYL